jgi:hypothetical protein
MNISKLRSILQQRYFKSNQITDLSILGDPRKGKVFNCRLDNGAEYIIKRVKYPWQVLKLKKVYSLLAETEWKYPPLLAADLSLAIWFALGSFISIEAKINGPSCAELSLDVQVIGQIAQSFAVLNGVIKRQWTRKDFFPHRGSYYNYCMRTGLKRLKEWLKTKPDLADRNKQYRLWFAQYKKPVDSIKLFNLLKVDTKDCHYICPNGDGVYAIDLEDLRFGVFWEDYLKLEDEFCETQEELERQLQEEYFKLLPDPSLGEKLKLENFFRALYYLQRISRCRIRLRHDDGHLPTIKQNYKRYEQALIRLLEG